MNATDPADPADLARESALRLLALRPRSEAEIRNRLRRRFPEETVSAVVSSLLRTALLGDEAFARWWAESRTGDRPMAAAMIAAELRAKGVCPDAVARAVDAVDDEANARILARRLARTKRAWDPGEFEQFARRLFGRMARRGYPADLVRSALREAWAEVVDLQASGRDRPACKMGLSGGRAG